MAERKRLECRNHGNCLWILEYMTSCDGHLPEWDGERHDCAEYEPMPDVKALCELANEMVAIAGAYPKKSSTSPLLLRFARRIRKALEVTDG